MNRRGFLTMLTGALAAVTLKGKTETLGQVGFKNNPVDPRLLMTFDGRRLPTHQEFTGIDFARGRDVTMIRTALPPVYWRKINEGVHPLRDKSELLDSLPWREIE